MLLFTNIAHAQTLFSSSPKTLTSAQSAMLSQKFTAFQTYKLNIPQLNSFVKSQPNGEASLTLQLGETINWPITLQQHEIRSGNFLLAQHKGNGTILEHKGVCNTYQGYLTNDPTQQVVLYISENFILGSVFSNGEKYIIEPLATYIGPEAVFNQDILVYKRSDMLIEQFGCATGDTEIFNVTEIETREDCNFPTCGSYGFPNVERYLELAIETDCEFFQSKMDMFVNQPNQFALAKIAAEAYVSQQVNLLDAYYTDAINLHASLVYTSLWTDCGTAQGQDPFTSNGIEYFWDQVRNYWNANMAWVQRDAVHCFSGKSFGYQGVSNGASQFTGLFAICGRNFPVVGPPHYSDSRHESYSVSSTYDSGFHTFAHEIGHLLGLKHVCDCSLMYSSNACIGTPPNCTPSDCLSAFSHEALCTRLNQTVNTVWGHPHDACLLGPPPTSPDFDIVIQKTNGGNFVEENDVICFGDNLDVSFTNTFNNYNATWNLGPGLAFVAPPTGTIVQVMVTTNSPMTSFVSATFDYQGNTFTFIRHLHIGVPLPVGPPIISSNYIPFAGTVFSVGFPMPPGANFIQYSYTVTIPNQPQNAYNGTTTNANPLVTGLPQNACVSFHLYPGNGCGTNYNPPYPSIDICFGGNPIIALPNDSNIALGQEIEKALSSPAKPDYGVAQKVSLQPNPASNRFLLFLSNPAKTIELRASDVNGRTIYYNTYNEVNGDIEVNTAEWAEGVYYLQVIQSGFVQQLKLVIQR